MGVGENEAKEFSEMAAMRLIWCLFGEVIVRLCECGGGGGGGWALGRM